MAEGNWQMRRATVERLQMIVDCRAAWLDERGDVFAARVLGAHPGYRNEDHWLANLDHAQYRSAVNNGMVTLSREHCRLLTEAISRPEVVDVYVSGWHE
jgi:hypothetical protein